MPHLSPKIQAWLKNYNRTMEELLAKGFKPTPKSVRKGLDDLTRRLVSQYPDIAWIRDDQVIVQQHTISLRIYHPNPKQGLPVLIYVHGGGHMAGSVRMYDPITRKMALATNHIVVSVDYRLAPEFPYPAGIEDTYDITKNIWRILDRHHLNYQKRLSIAGDSAGGAICATVAHKAQYDPAIEIHRQVLIYPSLDYTLTLPSISTNGFGYLLEKSKIQWYFDHYFHPSDNRKQASPLHMQVTSKLAETMIITAEYCPLRDEGTAYTDKLRSTAVIAKRLHFEDMIHAFMIMEDLADDACNKAYTAIGTFVNNESQ